MTQRAIFDKKNILVTGGAGFIGSHLCDALVKKSKVICVDNFLTGSEENIDHLLRNADFEFIRHDLTEPLKLESFHELEKFRVKFQGIQEIYHLACPTSPKDFNRVPIETLLANAYATRNVLDLAVAYHAKVLHFSTSAVYGEPLDEQPIEEQYWGYVDPVGVRSAYTEGKRFAEAMMINYQRQRGVDAKILRVFNTYGPRMRLNDGRMIPDFVVSVLENRPVKVYGTGEEKRSYCYVTDVVEAAMRMMESPERGPFNVGAEEHMRSVDIAKKIMQIVEITVETVLEKPPEAYAAKQSLPDIRLVKEKLGWFPIVSLEEGLVRTVKDMQGRKVIGFGDVKV